MLTPANPRRKMECPRKGGWLLDSSVHLLNARDLSSQNEPAGQPNRGSTCDGLCANHELMGKTAAILFTIVLAMFVTPLRLPAASCILLNAPSHEACKSKCCANMTCCAISPKNTGPAAQPLAVAKHQLIALLAAVPASFLAQPFRLDRVACASVPVRAHSPPPLAASCIRLI